MSAVMVARGWSVQDVHEALLRWGAIAARIDDGGCGYPSTSAGIVELRQRPWQALAPTDFADGEFDAINAAVRSLEQPLRVTVLCYYKPGHMRCAVPLGVDGNGRARSPSIRSIAVAMLVSPTTVAARLDCARGQIARHLTR